MHSGSLLGNKVSSSVKLFVLALAVADDLGSIVVLAIVYQQSFAWLPLIVAVRPIGIAINFRALQVSWIAGATLLARRLGIGHLPDGMGVREVLGIGALAGIGLNVSFLVANLAFTDQVRQNQAKLAVLVAAVVSALLAALILRKAAAGADGNRPPVERNGN